MSENLIDNDAPTLDTVNQNLLRKLNRVIGVLDEADTAALLEVTEAVAKLNASSKNNDRLGALKSDAKRTDEQISKMFLRKLGEAEIVND